MRQAVRMRTWAVTREVASAPFRFGGWGWVFRDLAPSLFWGLQGHRSPSDALRELTRGIPSGQTLRTTCGSDKLRASADVVTLQGRDTKPKGGSMNKGLLVFLTVVSWLALLGAYIAVRDVLRWI